MTKLVIDYPWMSMRNFFAVGGNINIPELLSMNLRSINKAINDYYSIFDEKITSITVACDYGSYRYRDKKKFTSYKSNRAKKPHPNIQTVFDVYKYSPSIYRRIGIDFIIIKGVEADDVGFYYANTESKCCFLTTDRDWKQLLVNDNHVLMSPKGNKSKYPLGYEIVFREEAYGNLTTPIEFAIMKTLEGDLSDNIDKLADIGSINEDTVRLFINDRDSLPKEVVEHISTNLPLTRLDHIMSDQEVIEGIKYSESLTANNVSLVDIYNEIGRNNIQVSDRVVENLHSVIKR